MVWNNPEKTRGRNKRDLDFIMNEQANCLEKFSQQFAYRQLRRQLDAIIRNDTTHVQAEVNQQFEQLKDSELLQDQVKFLSLEAERHYHHIRVAVHRRAGEKKLSFKHAGLLVDSFEQTDATKDPAYGMALSKRIHAAHNAENHEEFWRTLDKWKAFLESGADPKIQVDDITERISYWSLLYHLGTGQRDLAQKEVELIEEWWPAISPQLRTRRILAFAYNLMIYYWMTDDFQNSERWLKEILSFRSTEERSDIVIAAKLFQVILYAELFLQDIPSSRALDEVIDSARKTLPKEPQLQRLHKPVLQCVRRLTRLKPKESPNQHIEKLQKELLDLERKNEKILNLKEILLWCEARLENSALALLWERKGAAEVRASR